MCAKLLIAQQATNKVFPFNRLQRILLLLKLFGYLLLFSALLTLSIKLIKLLRS